LCRIPDRTVTDPPIVFIPQAADTKLHPEMIIVSFTDAEEFFRAVCFVLQPENGMMQFSG